MQIVKLSSSQRLHNGKHYIFICELIYVHAHMWASYTNKKKKYLKNVFVYDHIRLVCDNRAKSYVNMAMLICEHWQCSHMSIWHVRIWSYVCLTYEQAWCSHMNMRNKKSVRIWVLICEHSYTDTCILDCNVHMWALICELAIYMTAHMWTIYMTDHMWALTYDLYECSYVSFYDCSYVIYLWFPVEMKNKGKKFLKISDI